jgi:hypothetical protein
MEHHRPPRLPEQRFCEAHRLRRGAHVPAERIVDGEAMCERCFCGEELSPGRDEALGRAAPFTPGERTARGRTSTHLRT